MISDVEIENEIRASVAKFVEGMRALARKDVLQIVARHLEVDIRAAGISIESLAARIEPAHKAPARKPTRAKPAERKATTARAPERGPQRAKARKKPAASRPSRPAAPRPAPVAPQPPASAPEELGSAPAAAAEAGSAPAVEPPAQAEPTSGANEAAVEETAATLLAHIEIEPGQGLEELALAMGTPAAELEEPIKKLLDENKIAEKMRQGQAEYYPS